MYLLRDDPRPTLDYRPVKPEFSSSGTYDGGDPLSKNLTHQELARIQACIEDAMAARASHIAERLMGSGAITTKLGPQTQSCILAPNSPPQVTLESLLKEILQQ